MPWTVCVVWRSVIATGGGGYNRLGWAKLVTTLRSLSSAEEEDVDVKDINVVVVVRWTVSLHDGQFRSGQVKGMGNYITDYIIEVI